jgi:hypothetical protein
MIDPIHFGTKDVHLRLAASTVFLARIDTFEVFFPV